MPAIDTLETQLANLQEQAAEFLTRDDFDPEDPGYKAITLEADRLTRSIKEQGQWQARKSASDEASAMVRRAQVRQSDAAADPVSGESAGEIFTRSAQFAGYTGYGNSGRVAVGDTLTRALPMTTAGLPSALALGNKYLADPSLATPLLDLIPQVVTSLGSFPVWGMVPAAGTDATDSGATVVAEGADKPSLEFEEATIDVALKTVAVWTSITRQALEDIPMVRSMIDNGLRRSVLKALEAEAMTAVGTVTATAAAPAGGNLQAAIRLGIATVQTAGWQPNAVAVAPSDAAAVDIAALKNACCSNDNFWSLRVVPVPGMAAGTAIVGDFTNGATTYARTAGVDVFITDSHADTFTKNVFTILAETRRATVIERADAFVKVSVTP